MIIFDEEKGTNEIAVPFFLNNLIFSLPANQSPRVTISAGSTRKTRVSPSASD